LNPTGVPDTTVALFFTRWVTHFCAPVFVFLAGTAAWLYGSRGRSKAELSRFLWTRGLWLVFLDFTVVYLAWFGDFGLRVHFFQVIAAIGAALIALAGLVYLSTRAVAVLGLVILCGHNLFDGFVSADFGSVGWVWILLHEGNITSAAPFVSVGALGLALTAAFFVLRGVDTYGDPGPWSAQDSPVMTALSFLNTQKYPPALLFALMTLGPSIALLGLLDREPGRLGRALIVFGRVPLFYYVLHIALIHASSALMYKLLYGQAFSAMRDGFASFFGGPPVPE
jgi:uncharacterized membrane protein